MRKVAVGIGLVVSFAVLQFAGLTPKWRGDAAKSEVKLVAGSSTAKTAAFTRQSRNIVASSYGKLPIAFEPNLGQANPEARFLAHGAGYGLFLTPQETVFVLSAGSNNSGVSPNLTSAAKTSSASAAVLRMKLLGANKAPVFASQDQLPGKSNYLSGKDPNNWRTDVPTYRRVAEQGGLSGY